jgi:hypothetical protein
MILQQKFTTEAYLRHLYVIYNEVPVEDRDAILPALEDEIRRHNEFIIRNTEILTGIAIQMTILREASNKSKQRMIDSQPIFHNHLLAMFLDSHSEVVVELNERKSVFLNEEGKDAFFQFFKAWGKKVKSFIIPIADDALYGVAPLFHSFLMQQLTLREFQNANDKFMKSDELFIGVNVRTVQRVCVDAAPPEIWSLFDSPSLFNFAINSLQRAQFLEMPLEAIREISLAMNIIEEMFRLETGLDPDDSYLSHLFNYSLLASGVPNWMSFAKYVEHFLSGLPETEFLALNERLTNILSSFYNRMLALAVKLMETRRLVT